MALSDAQKEAVVTAVAKKAESMVENRVNARGGTAADKKLVKAAIAKRLTAK
jgi:hypothetical protein